MPHSFGHPNLAPGGAQNMKNARRDQRIESPDGAEMVRNGRDPRHICPGISYP
ncbi:hypothetical protein Poly51_41260 [Rubripirellula tenax]|uniref:Uncharacterized protein n=1 Tax=Rubripirellula tenax TaxID=2528015 RepID=A0A5C6EM57_9BACT|nr:hypothetical protein Poly51_41260 [Rubripirellula tenax]